MYHYQTQKFQVVNKDRCENHKTRGKKKKESHVYLQSPEDKEKLTDVPTILLNCPYFIKEAKDMP